MLVKFFQVIWNNSVEFAKVVIHLGDLHAFMEFFGVIGKLVFSSGFEDVIYQADMCTSGNVRGVLSGKHYNKAWVLNECFAEAIDRLFCEKYVEMPTEVEKNLKEMTEEITPDNIESSHSSDTNIYEDIVNKAKNDCLAGAYGKTPQFWMKYVSAVERLHTLHYAINKNMFDLRLEMWEEALRACFAMNKVNYARYGTYYILQLQNLEETYPGAKEEIETKGISVCRNYVNIRQSIDGAGESTFMKSAKTAGGIKDYTTQDSTYEKWVLSRPAQAEYATKLLSIADMSKDLSKTKKVFESSRNIEV